MCWQKISTLFVFNPVAAKCQRLSSPLQSFSSSALGVATLSKFGWAVECREARQARAVVTSELSALSALLIANADWRGPRGRTAQPVCSIASVEVISPRPSSSKIEHHHRPLFTANGDRSCKANVRMSRRPNASVSGPKNNCETPSEKIKATITNCASLGSVS